jgi:hypothetical protein
MFYTNAAKATMKTIVTFAALFFLAACGESSNESTQENSTDTMAPSVVVPNDTTMQTMPVEPMDTSKSTMPVIDPDTARVKPL